jgi:hypothetical protein
MKIRHLVTATAVAAGLLAGTAVPASATVIGKPGSYCKKAERGHKVTYTTPKTHKRETVICREVHGKWSWHVVK